MNNNHLLREHAPISDSSWQLLDEEARQRLTPALGARKLVDFGGPFGWSYSATNLGRTEAVRGTPVPKIVARQRGVLPLTEARAEFAVARAELEDNDRGAADVNLDALDEAALSMAALENTAVFHGWKEVGITGITSVSPHTPVPRVENFEDYPERVAKGVAALLKSGISGPFGLSLGPEDYTAVIETAEDGGYPMLEHLRKILDGPIVWTPGVKGGVVLSLRGGDFLFESGQDLAIGFRNYDADNVYLYLEQSFSFRVATPEASITLAGE